MSSSEKTEGDSMPANVIDFMRQVPPVVQSDLPTLSDDGCLIRLARAVEARDSRDLREVARLLGRLTVIIE